MDWLRGLAIIWCICVIVSPIMALCCIWEEIEKRIKKKDKYLIEQRRREFAEDCERAGRNMINADRIQKIVAENGKKQNIKYTGLFSGADVETALSLQQK